MNKEVRNWIIVILLAFALAFVVRAFIVQPYRIEMDSMMTTLHPNDLILVDKLSYRMRPPKRGEIVVFTPPVNKKSKYIKRVIGLPGETLQIRNDTVYINGKKLNEPYMHSPMLTDYGPIKIKKGYVFVMGDNRSISEDSRYFGPIPIKSIVGRAVVVYLPFKHIENLNAYSGENP